MATTSIVAIMSGRFETQKGTGTTVYRIAALLDLEYDKVHLS
jgi:hypothetical protein